MEVSQKVYEEELKLLCSPSKLERDKGYLALKSKILKEKNICDEVYEISVEFQNDCINFLESTPSKSTWEQNFGYLQACKIIVETERFKPEFSKSVVVCGLKFLEDDEFRVRIAAGELLGLLCKHIDQNIYKQCEPVLINTIRKNLSRELHISDSDEHKDAKDIFHDTAGWKCLETSMKGLQAVIQGCGEYFLQFLNFDLLNLVFETLNHTNRFVRETGYYVCSSLARYGVSSHQSCDQDMVSKLAEHLRVGLADNWSQVRLAASVATREFFQDLNESDKEKYLQILLPPMCLNRYYLAEGVRLYNQESWRIVLGTQGRNFVESFINQVVIFYVEQTESDNHAVREASCHCIAELGLKISKDAVQPYVSKLLEALLICFKDESWPVRDTACLACGNFVLSFPDDCRAKLDVLYPLFFANLGDPIPSVRQGGAIALSNIVRAYKGETHAGIFDKIANGLRSVENQKATSERYESMDKGTATYGVIKQLRDNDLDLHSNQQMYSCGSLAPKMKRGAGCMDHNFKRESEPWEFADGCLYLLCELSDIQTVQEMVRQNLELVVKASTFKHYTHYLHFYETVDKVLPVIGKRLGKRVFKQYIELFLDVIFTSLSCEIALTRTAAVECLHSLSELIGPNILHGRVEQYNFRYVKLLEDALRDSRIQVGIPKV